MSSLPRQRGVTEFLPERGVSSLTLMVTENAQKGSLVDCQEDVSYTALTIVCTINMSIDCDCFDVSNPSTMKKYTQKKIKSMRCLVCVLFLKIIVCKDDEIPAFSAMM